MKFKNIMALFLIVHIVHTNYSMKRTPNTTATPQCLFALLPENILNYIAYFIRFANNSYEDDELFAERLRTTQPGLLKRKEILSDTQHLEINKFGSLQLITQSPKASKKSNSREKIIKSAIDNSAFFNAFLSINPDFTPDNKVQYFSASPTKNCVAVLLYGKGGERIEVHYLLDDKKKSATQPFFTKNYYNKEGTFIATSDIKKEECEARDYFTKKEYPRFTGDHMTYALLDVSRWYNPIHLIAVSHDGQVAFVNDHQLFLIKKDGTHKNIYQDRRKYIGPLNFSRALCYPWRKYRNIIGIGFNKQGTKVAIVYHKLFDFLEDVKPDEEHTKMLQNPPLFGEYFKKLIIPWLSNHVGHTSASDLHDLETVPVDKFAQKLKEVLPTESYGRVINDILKKSDRIDLNSTVKVINHSHESPWTLQKYFALRGVCKDLRKSLEKIEG